MTSSTRKLIENLSLLFDMIFLAEACADPTPYYAELEFSLVPPVDGRFDEDVYVIMHCNDTKHHPVGSKFSVCKKDGTWNPAPLTCYGNNRLIICGLY